MLESVNPYSFPTPIKIGRKAGALHFDVPSEEYLDRSDLKKIYGACGDVLHRGALKHALGATPRTDVQKLNGWTKQLSHLLWQHMIMLPFHDTVLMIKFYESSGAGGGDPSGGRGAGRIHF